MKGYLKFAFIASKRLSSANLPMRKVGNCKACTHPIMKDYKVILQGQLKFRPIKVGEMSHVQLMMYM